MTTKLERNNDAKAIRSIRALIRHGRSEPISDSMASEVEWMNLRDNVWNWILLSVWAVLIVGGYAFLLLK